MNLGTSMSARLLAAAVVGLGLAGCATRSISDSDRWGGYSPTRELHEYSVLGIAPNTPVTDEVIAAAMAGQQPFTMPRGSRVLLIQSGAMMPDEPMQVGLSQHFSVAPFSGIPMEDEGEANYAGALRMAAAKGGYEYIVCYWGVLETAEHDLVSKTVSWVPIVGYAVPDMTQEMRIRLRIIGLDVRTGRWAMLTPAVHGDKSISARANREDSDQNQVRLLKDMGYASAAEAIVQAWGS